jgi:peptidoglycan hydrolase-like protein with peptidoglycan-binding domain
MSSTTATRSPKARTVATVIAGALAGAGIVAAAVVGFTGHSQANASAAPAPSSPASTAPYQPNQDHRGGTPVNVPKVRPAPAPAAVPSAAVKLLQQQLAQLNYYDGPVTGVENTNTVHAIQYLQRDAHLPQTGQLNGATRAALNSMLVHGNNQMAG